eukprot:COSAG06_NODE_8745_length_2080_cov_13.108026_2_plen_165_part_00
MRCARKPCGDGCPCAHAAAFSLSLHNVIHACAAVFFSFPLALALRTRASSSYLLCESSLPRRPCTLPSDLFCLVPAAAADSAAVSRGDGDGAARIVVVVGPPVPGAVRWSRRRAIRPTRVQGRGEVVVAAGAAIIERVAGAQFPLRAPAVAVVIPVQHGAVGAA